MRSLPLLTLLLVSACGVMRVEAPSQTALRSAAEDLLDADRAFSSVAARTDFVTGVSAMFAADVIVPVPGAGFSDGIEAAVDVLLRDSLNATSRASWRPVRAGVSADRRHGFTIGYFEVVRADGTVVPGKYLAYWIKSADGWRVAVWRRTRRPEGPTDTTTFTHSLPARLAAATTDSTLLLSHGESLARAEHDFSSEAQVIGIGPAFAKFGRADAIHLGGPTNRGFVFGNDSIAASVQLGTPEGTSPVTWGPERVLVASSGDLGISIGYIVAKEPPPSVGTPARFPFFTIWRRDDANAPWRYIAE